MQHVMIIGAMKAGTTSLFRYLARHPEIAPCRVKEPEFFSRNQGHGARATTYEELWDFDPDQHRYGLEASTGYTKYPYEDAVPERIQAYGLQPRFIYLLRDPIRRIESQYNFSRSVLGRDADDLLSDRYVYGSRYHLQLSQFTRVFPNLDRYLLLDFDTLVHDPQRLLARCYAFLALDPDETPFDSMKPANTTPRNVVDRWIRQHKHQLRAYLPSFVRRGLKHGWVRAQDTVDRVAPPVETRRATPAERMQLRTRLQDDMARLQRDFGFDTGGWGF